jgi:membrane protease YdiL (CAAX protease family)
VAGAAVIVLLDSLLNGGQRLPQFTKAWALADWKLFAAGWLAALFTNQGGLLEELGWRGYAWPVLVRRIGSPLLAAVLLGVAWSLWHLPREILPIAMGQFAIGRFLVEQGLFIVACIGMTIVAVTFVNYLGGSVLPAIIIHGTLNNVYLAFETARTGVRSDMTITPNLFWVTAAVVTLLVVGRDLGWKRRSREPLGYAVGPDLTRTTRHELSGPAIKIGRLVRACAPRHAGCQHAPHDHVRPVHRLRRARRGLPAHRRGRQRLPRLGQ